jgi:hypothetical protein
MYQRISGGMRRLKMTMPAGIVKKTKDNSKKKWRERKAWMVAKKIGRTKQQWSPNGGYWEKVPA